MPGALPNAPALCPQGSCASVLAHVAAVGPHEEKFNAHVSWVAASFRFMYRDAAVWRRWRRGMAQRGKTRALLSLFAYCCLQDRLSPSLSC